MTRTTTAARRAKERRAAYEEGTLTPAIEKWCKMCDVVRPAHEFYIRFDADHLLSHYCKDCHKKDCKIRKRIKRLQTHEAST